MTRRTSARVAGYAFLLYIAIGITQLVTGGGAARGDGPAARLASIAANASRIRIDLLVTLLICVIALTLAVALFAITRDEDREVALVGLVCRLIESAIPVIPILATLSLLWLAESNGVNAPDAAGAQAMAALLFKVRGWTPLLGATFFAFGSTAFSWLMLRGRLIPVPLAWIGVVASVLLVTVLPLELVGLVSGPVTQFVWLPMLAFEVPLGFWLIIRGVNTTPRS